MKVVVFALVLLATGCRKEAPPAPTSQETEQLNDAESMLNQLANEEGPAPEGTGPSN